MFVQELKTKPGQNHDLSIRGNSKCLAYPAPYQTPLLITPNKKSVPNPGGSRQILGGFRGLRAKRTKDSGWAGGAEREHVCFISLRPPEP